MIEIWAKCDTYYGYVHVLDSIVMATHYMTVETYYGIYRSGFLVPFELINVSRPACLPEGALSERPKSLTL